MHTAIAIWERNQLAVRILFIVMVHISKQAMLCLFWWHYENAGLFALTSVIPYNFLRFYNNLYSMNDHFEEYHPEDYQPHGLA